MQVDQPVCVVRGLLSEFWMRCSLHQRYFPYGIGLGESWCCPKSDSLRAISITSRPAVICKHQTSTLLQL